MITRSDGKKMLIFIFMSNRRGGGGGGLLAFDIGTFVSPVFFRLTLFIYTRLQKRIFSYSCMIYIVLVPIDVSILCNVDLLTL